MLMGKAIASLVTATLLAVGLTGCIQSHSPLTSEQVELWREMGEQMIPAATDVHIEAGSMQGMFGGGSNFMQVEATFASLSDLKDNMGMVDDFGAVLEEESGALVDTAVINAGAGAFGEEVGTRLRDEVPGVDGAIVETNAWFDTNSGVPQLTATAYVYVTDEDVVDPAWLDAVVDTTQQAVDEEGGGSVSGVHIYPAEILESGSAGSHLGRYRFEVWALPGIRGVVENVYCVRTDSWAYDVSKRSASVYPASEPGGACAAATEED